MSPYLAEVDMAQQRELLRTAAGRHWMTADPIGVTGAPRRPLRRSAFRPGSRQQMIVAVR
jgi:hypothetical protein